MDLHFAMSNSVKHKWTVECVTEPDHRSELEGLFLLERTGSPVQGIDWFSIREGKGENRVMLTVLLCITVNILAGGRLT